MCSIISIISWFFETLKDDKKNSNTFNVLRSYFEKSHRRSRAKRHSGGPTGPSLSYATRWIAWGPRWVNYKVRRNADSIPVPWSLLLLFFLTLFSSTVPIVFLPERPTSIQHFELRYDTPSAWLLCCEIYSALSSSLHSIHPLFSFLFHKYLFLLSFVRSRLLLLVHFLSWWILAREHLRSALLNRVRRISFIH